MNAHATHLISDRFSYGSVCSGIEAASVAWHQFGWRPAWLSEIDEAASAVLAYRMPTIPNLGDMTAIAPMIEAGIVEAPDILVGGTPCQGFSVAGRRGGLSDPRGQLTLSFVEIADAIDSARRAAGDPESIIVWENVPGVLSMRDNAFGNFLAALAGEDVPLEPTGKRWSDAGVVCGPERAVAWRTLDAQFFGLAQRRRRVFVVASAREGFDPGEVLLEWEGVRRDSKPSRTKGQGATYDVAPSLTGSGRGLRNTGETRGQDPVVGVRLTNRVSEGEESTGRSHWDGDYPHPALSQVGTATGGVGQSNQSVFSQRGAYLVPADVVGARMLGFGHYEIDETASTIKARDFKDATDLVIGPVPEVSDCLTARMGRNGMANADRQAMIPVCITGEITHTLKAEGFDASEDGTGRGQPIIPVAFTAKDYGGDATEDMSPTLRSGGHADSHANGGVMPAVAYAIMPMNSGRDYKARETDVAQPLMADGPVHGNQGGDYICHPVFSVRTAQTGANGIGVDEHVAPSLDCAAPSAVAYAFQPRIARNGRGDMGDVVNALTAEAGTTGKGDAAPCVAYAQTEDVIPFDTTQLTHPANYSNPQPGDPCHPLAAGAHAPAIFSASMAVRRLMPVECERLQGFPDGWTRIPIRFYKSKKVSKLRPDDMWEPGRDEKGNEGWWLMAADGPRYKQLGNSMATHCMAWIGWRIRNWFRMEPLRELIG